MSATRKKKHHGPAKHDGHPWDKWVWGWALLGALAFAIILTTLWIGHSWKRASAELDRLSRAKAEAITSAVDARLRDFLLWTRSPELSSLHAQANGFDFDPFDRVVTKQLMEDKLRTRLLILNHGELLWSRPIWGSVAHSEQPKGEFWSDLARGPSEYPRGANADMLGLTQAGHWLVFTRRMPLEGLPMEQASLMVLMVSLDALLEGVDEERLENGITYGLRAATGEKTVLSLLEKGSGCDLTPPNNVTQPLFTPRTRDELCLVGVTPLDPLALGVMATRPISSLLNGQWLPLFTMWLLCVGVLISLLFRVARPGEKLSVTIGLLTHWALELRDGQLESLPPANDKLSRESLLLKDHIDSLKKQVRMMAQEDSIHSQFVFEMLKTDTLESIGLVLRAYIEKTLESEYLRISLSQDSQTWREESNGANRPPASERYQRFQRILRLPGSHENRGRVEALHKPLPREKEHFALLDCQWFCDVTEHRIAILAKTPTPPPEADPKPKWNQSA